MTFIPTYACLTCGKRYQRPSNVWFSLDCVECELKSSRCKTCHHTAKEHNTKCFFPKCKCIEFKQRELVSGLQNT